jgi:hypothetical protein
MDVPSGFCCCSAGYGVYEGELARFSAVKDSGRRVADRRRDYTPPPLAFGAPSCLTDASSISTSGRWIQSDRQENGKPGDVLPNKEDLEVICFSYVGFKHRQMFLVPSETDCGDLDTDSMAKGLLPKNLLIPLLLG